MINRIYSKQDLKKIDLKLQVLGKKIYAEEFIQRGIIYSLVCLAFCVAISAYAGFYPILVLSPLPYFLNIYYVDLLYSKRVEEIENSLADVLFQAAGSPTLNNIESVVSEIASRREYGALAEEFSLVKKSLRVGKDLDSALKEMAERVDSALVKRALRLLSTGVKSGADISDALRRTAEDSMELNSLKNERRAVMAFQKYTLLAACIIAPLLITYMILNLQTLNIERALSMISDMSAGSRTGLFSMLKLGVSLYLVAFPLTISAFIAKLEDNIARAIIYASFTLPVSLILSFLLT